jgi:hypothetical protein
MRARSGIIGRITVLVLITSLLLKVDVKAQSISYDFEFIDHLVQIKDYDNVLKALDWMYKQGSVSDSIYYYRGKTHYHNP